MTVVVCNKLEGWRPRLALALLLVYVAYSTTTPTTARLRKTDVVVENIRPVMPLLSSVFVICVAYLVIGLILQCKASGHEPNCTKPVTVQEACTTGSQQSKGRQYPGNNSTEYMSIDMQRMSSTRGAQDKAEERVIVRETCLDSTQLALLQYPQQYYPQHYYPPQPYSRHYYPQQPYPWHYQSVTAETGFDHPSVESFIHAGVASIVNGIAEVTVHRPQTPVTESLIERSVHRLDNGCVVVIEDCDL